MAAARQKGEGKLSTVRQIAALPMPEEPASVRRRRLKAAGRTVDCLTAAKQAVADADRRRAKEHELDYVIPKRVAAKSQIERLFDDGTVDEQQKRAADRLLSDFATSGFEPGVIASYSGAGVGGAGMIGSGPTAREYMMAMIAIGPALVPVVIAVLWFDVSPSVWAGKNGRQNAKDGVPMLRAALDNLAIHYGMKRSPFAPRPQSA
jgi:hypothetical protein